MGATFMQARLPRQHSVVPVSTDGGPAADEVSATSFGPKGCVGLSRSSLGTCVIRVACGEADIAKVDFSFVCNSRTEPTKQHSYGLGGFLAGEVFDSGVACDSCTSVAFAQRSGGRKVHNEVLEASAPAEQQFLAKESADVSPKGFGPLHGPSANGIKPRGVNIPAAVIAPQPVSTKEKEAEQKVAFFGPSACVSTYLSPNGTCVIQTRCRGVNLTSFVMGITCLDKTGDYTRYLFGKGGFEDEETFDTSLRCEACIGVGSKPTYQLSGIMPKTVLEGLNSLRSEMSSLREEVNMLKRRSQGASNSREAQQNIDNSTEIAHQQSAKASDVDGIAKANSTTDGNATESTPSANATESAPSTQSTAPKPAGKEQLLQAVEESGAAGVAVGGKPVTVRDLLRRIAQQR